MRLPPKSSDGWSLMQKKKLESALSGCPRAIEMAPSTWRSPVTEVRSMGMGSNPRSANSSFTLA